MADQPDEQPTAEYAAVPPPPEGAGAIWPLPRLHAPGAPPEVAVTPEPVAPGRVTPPVRRTVNRRVAVWAGLVALVLIAVPALAVRLTASPTPAGAPLVPASPSGSAVVTEPAGDAPTTDSPDRAAPGADAQAAESSPAAAPAPEPTGGGDGPEPDPEPPPDEPDEDPPPGPWSTIVDNSSGRFSASGNWRTSSDSAQRYGSNFRYASPVESSDPAWYRVDIPETGRYRVDVWFPAKPGYNERTPYIVATTDGNQTIHISQRNGGGGWVTIGTFTIAAGDKHVVAVSRWRVSGTGYVIADAVRVTEA